MVSFLMPHPTCSVNGITSRNGRGAGLDFLIQDSRQLLLRMPSLNTGGVPGSAMLVLKSFLGFTVNSAMID